MATKLINDTYLTDIANAIRSKKGTSNTMTPSQMGDEIRSITGGGGDLNILNGYLRNCVTSEGTIQANHFVKMEQPILTKFLSTLTLSGSTEAKNYEGLSDAIKVNDTTVLITTMQWVQNPLVTEFDFKYYLIKINLDDSYTILDNGLFNHPPESNHWTISKEPTRIFQARNGTYFYFYGKYFFPFIIENNSLIQGEMKEFPNLSYYAYNTGNVHYDDMNASTYVQLEDDYVTVMSISGNSASTSRWILCFLTIKVQDNEIKSVYQQNFGSSVGVDNYPNILTFDETNHKYGLVLYTGSPSGNATFAAYPLTITWDSTIGSSGFYKVTYNSNAASWWNATVRGFIIPSYVDNTYWFISSAINTPSHIRLTVANAGPDAPGVEAHLLTNYLRGVPADMNTYETSISVMTGQTMPSVIKWDNNYYFWPNWDGANSHGLVIVKEDIGVDSLRFIARVMPYTNMSRQDSITRFGTYFVWGKGHSFDFDKANTLTRVVADITDPTSEQIYGVCKTAVTTNSGSGYFLE